MRLMVTIPCRVPELEPKAEGRTGIPYSLIEEPSMKTLDKEIMDY